VPRQWQSWRARELLGEESLQRECEYAQQEKRNHPMYSGYNTPCTARFGILYGVVRLEVQRSSQEII
jgi:hypothetical protein